MLAQPIDKVDFSDILLYIKSLPILSYNNAGLFDRSSFSRGFVPCLRAKRDRHRGFFLGEERFRHCRNSGHGAGWMLFWYLLPGNSRFLPDAASPVHMLGLLTASVVVTALLVAFSHMLYPVAERYFVQQTNDILEDAKIELERQRPSRAGAHA